MMNIVIVGAGMAGCKLAESLVNAHQGNMNITLVSEEAQVGYNRILLSSLLAQDITEDQLAFVDITKLKAKGVTVLSGDPAVSINNAQNLVSLRSGKKLSYDKLVLATGSQPTHLPVFDSTAKNVMAFRTWEDANTLAALPAPQNIAVIGAGLLGLEAAVGLAKKGHIVTVFHRAIHIMNRQLDSTAANLLQTNLERMGVRFCLTDTPQAALTNTANHVTHLTRKNGSSIVVDLVILAVGISPEVSLAKTASLAINRAIIVNAQMQSSADDIYALGE